MNCILGINTGRGRLVQVDEVRLETQNHFQNSFQESKSIRPKLDGVNFRQLSDVDRIMSEDHFYYEEINEVAWQCDGEKALVLMDTIWDFSRSVGCP